MGQVSCSSQHIKLVFVGKIRIFTVYSFSPDNIRGDKGIYLLQDLGWVKLSVKSTVLGGNILGGLLFGLGWGLLGYCPGTSAGALGEGRWDAVWGILGMLAGAALFAEAYPGLKKTVLTWGDFGKITLPQILGINPWIIIVILIIGGLLLFRWFERKGL